MVPPKYAIDLAQGRGRRGLYTVATAANFAEVKLTPRSVKSLVCALSLALMLASSAVAAKKIRKPVPHQAAAASSERCRGANLFPCGPIYNGNDYLGEDPDPFIRSQILRDLGAKYGGSD